MIFLDRKQLKGNQLRLREPNPLCMLTFLWEVKNDKLLYCVDDGKWEDLEYTTEADPSISTHMWKVKIPSDLEIGTHKFEIKATDMFGKIHTASRDYRIDTIK